jgi:hypothetical protein
LSARSAVFHDSMRSRRVFAKCAFSKIRCVSRLGEPPRVRPLLFLIRSHLDDSTSELNSLLRFCKHRYSENVIRPKKRRNLRERAHITLPNPNGNEFVLLLGSCLANKSLSFGVCQCFVGFGCSFMLAWSQFQFERVHVGFRMIRCRKWLQT